MVTLETKLANVMGGKNARACDNCIRKRARWYCPADDAFLCQICDGSVHSVNPLARRHDRVRLKTSSLKPSKLTIEIPQAAAPSWLHGFTKKARTPRGGGGRHAKAAKLEGSERTPIHHLVPQICGDEMETSHEEENDEQLLYRVPIFDPFVGELCSTSTTTPNSNIEGGSDNNESKVMLNHSNYDHQIHGSLPSEMELAEFAADVESLLGKGLDGESFDIQGLGFSDCKVEKVEREDDELAVVDQEADHHCHDGEMDVMMMSRDEAPFELSFDYDDSDPTANFAEEGREITGREDDQTTTTMMMMASEDHHRCNDDGDGMISGNGIENGDGKILLRLDYDGVISAWNDQRSPWTTGERPELESLCWPDCMGGCGTAHFPYGGDQVAMFGHPAALDGGREARVSRYREKRRTRLFAKKIRYEVRKLNAEKRPRMKGRFVKRANLTATGIPFSVHTK